ncbi:MAG: hypothetical protein LKJ60_13195, partial [Lentilactobacillus buchneri]|nr:hypothetical protein [Lentilactobacillus buchneri]
MLFMHKGMHGGSG